MKSAVKSCIAGLLALMALAFFAFTAAAAELPWRDLYKDYLVAEAAKLRCFVMLADLDFDGMPELLFGVPNKEDGEIRIEACSAKTGRVEPITRSAINGAFKLDNATLSLLKDKSGYFWSLMTTGLESPNGRWQTRYTDLVWMNDGLDFHNRFTKRTSYESSVYMVEGQRLSEETYNAKFDARQNDVKLTGRAPQAALGDAETQPDDAVVLSAYTQLLERYQAFIQPAKFKVVAEKKRLKLNAKVKSKLQITPGYGASIRGAVAYSSSDPKILKVGKKSGSVRAVGYGTASVIATLPSGVSARAKVSVPRPRTQKVIVRAESKSLKKGEQMQLFYSFAPRGSRAGVEFISSDPAVVQVDKKTGLVTAMKRGKARITCQVNEKVRGSIGLEVKNGDLVTAVGLSDEKIELSIGERYALGVSVQPESANNKELRFSSSNSAVASVNEAGWIIALAPGSATVTASALGGARALVSVSVKQDDYLMDAPIGDGVYKLRQGADKALGVSGEKIQLQKDADEPSQRFLIRRAGDGFEISPLSAQGYLCVRSDETGTALLLSEDAAEAERRFKLTRLGGGAYAFYLAARPTVSFGAGEDGTAAVQDYTETGAGGRFLLEPMGEYASKPEASRWAEHMRAYIREHEAQVSAMSHLELCDLDWNGVPELVLFTGKRDKAVTRSLTAMEALVYSPEAHQGILGRFEYEPGENGDFGSAPPLIRLFVTPSAKRHWVLTDGLSGRTGSLRYTLIEYSQGVVDAKKLFEKLWMPASEARSELTDEQYLRGDKVITSFAYEQLFQEYFKGATWPGGATAAIECRGKSAEEIIGALNIAIAGRNWRQ